jgi:predicted DNA-binding protein (MmcQ/YjbR family)
MFTLFFEKMGNRRAAVNLKCDPDRAQELRAQYGY